MEWTVRRKWSKLAAPFMQGIEENVFYSLSKCRALNLSRLFQIAFFQYPVVLNLGQLFILLQQLMVSTTRVTVDVLLLQ